MKVVIIGTGNVAAVFGRLLVKAGYELVQVFGRTEESAERLAGRLACPHTSSWEAISKKADFYLVAIADDALYELEQHLTLPGQLIVHTAGSVSKSVLERVSVNYGVLYPLQSLRKDMPVLTEIPLLVDAVNEAAVEQLMQVATSLSSRVLPAGDEVRLKLHLSAVVVNNFVNHLYLLTADFCAKEDIRFEWLFPLMTETTKRMELVSPGEVVTGPAVRNDEVTINKHLGLLETYPLLSEQYEYLTRSIRAAWLNSKE